MTRRWLGPRRSVAIFAGVHVHRAARGIDKPRWPYLGALQKNLLLDGLGVWLACALPWAVVLGKALWGAPMAVSWVLWGGLVTIAGAIAKWRVIAALSGLAGGAVAVFFAAWQTVHIFDGCGFTLSCVPGPGLGVLLVTGVFAVAHSVLLYRSSDPRRGP